MNIFYIANARIPTEKAHGVQIMKMCESFSNIGHSVTLLVPKRKTSITDNPFEYYVVKDIFSLRKIFTLDFVKYGKFGFIIQSVTFAMTSFFILVRKKNAIFYSRDELPLLLLSFFKDKNSLVWEAHMPRKGIVTRILLQRLDRIVVISQGLKDFFISQGFSEKQITVAHDGVDLNQFEISVTKKQARKKLYLPQNKKIVMYVGLLDRWKGVNTLLEASELPEMKEVQVVIIGDGPMYKEYSDKYKNVIFKGFLPYRNLPQNQRAADLLVIPNSKRSKVSNNYTSPLKVFTSMASNIPVVASNIPSLKEVLNESNAYFAESDDPVSFAKVITHVFSDYDLALIKAKKAATDVTYYSWDNRAENIITAKK